MKWVIEFVGYFMSKTGLKVFEFDFGKREASVRDLINEAEIALIDREFKVVENGKLKNGVLVFSTNINGGIERIFDIDALLDNEGGKIIMANLMGGG